MRKITSILAVFCLFTVFLASCSKSDSSEETTTSSNSLVGTWGIKSVDGQEITDACTKKSSLVFSSTTATVTMYGKDNLGVCISVSGTGTYTISGNKLTTKDAEDGSTSTITIITLNETTYSYRGVDNRVYVWTKK